MNLVLACWAINVILFIMAITFIRSDKKEYAVSILPLFIVPTIHIMSGLLSKKLDGVFVLGATEIRVIIDAVSGLLSCFLLGLSSTKIKDESNRKQFFVFCSFFIIVLTGALIVNTLNLGVKLP